jgi:PPK2 family polyphosphate:nucleotide phosphotransferase
MKLRKQIDKMLVKPGSKVQLKDHPTDYDNKGVEKQEAAQLLQNGINSMILLQDKLYSHNEHSVLVVVQAMDAAGKDSIVKHVLSGLNPTGVRVTPFKSPTDIELEHDYLWRHNLALPSRGEIGIFVRSHYENVLVTRVHPEYILREKIPGIYKLKHVDKAFFKQRFRQINDWERHLSENGMTIIKIFLHSSKDEQKKQFIDRIDDPSKNWKFSMGDLKERLLWDQYMGAYEDLLNHTSTKYAPWFIVPADDRWFARVSVSAIIQNEFEKLRLKYPEVSPEQKEALASAKTSLLSEPDDL